MGARAQTQKSSVSPLSRPPASECRVHTCGWFRALLITFSFRSSSRLELNETPSGTHVIINLPSDQSLCRGKLDLVLTISTGTNDPGDQACSEPWGRVCCYKGFGGSASEMKLQEKLALPIPNQKQKTAFLNHK